MTTSIIEKCYVLWGEYMAAPIQRSTLAHQAVGALLELIDERGLKENDILPSTADLSEALGVSRTTIREAIAELAGQGMFNRRQGRETYITLPSAQQFEHLLHLRFALQGHNYEGLQEYREVMEVGSARLAALRATEMDIKEMERLTAVMSTAVTDDERHHADQAFHREVASASRNDLMIFTLDGITPILFQLRKRAWLGWKKSGKGADLLVEAHVKIVEKIRLRDGEGAADAMKEHLAQAQEGLNFKPHK